MFDFHEKRKVRNIIYSKPVLALLGIIIVMLMYSVWGVYIKEHETLLKKNQRAQVLEELEEREQILQKEINRLNTPHGIDEEIRSKFEVAGEGEGVVIIVEDKGGGKEGNVQDKPGLWERIKGIF